MLHEALRIYLERIETAVGVLKHGYLELYQEEALSSDRINLRIRYRFLNGCLLELNETVFFQDRLNCLSYRYHFQDPSNELVFRYDNAPHFPGLPTFPNHKHLPNGTVPAEHPDILDVITEADRITRRWP